MLALLAIRILSTGQHELLRSMDDFMTKQEDDVLQKAARLEAVGYESYLAQYNQL